MAHAAYYVSSAYDRARSAVARWAAGCSAPQAAPRAETEAAVALEAQSERVPLALDPEPVPEAIATALDVRRYAQDVCPICLAGFEEGYVRATTDAGTTCVYCRVDMYTTRTKCA